jgi:serine/threonine protein kinase
MDNIVEILQKCKDKRRNYSLGDVTHTECIMSFEDTTRIGSSSSFGKVYKVCCNNECKYILKVISLGDNGETIVTDESIQNEVTMQKKFHKKGLAPQLIDAYNCDNNAYIIMERMNIDVLSLIKRIMQLNIEHNYQVEFVFALLAKAISLLDKAHIYGLTHGDPHLENFMINTNLNILKIFQNPYDIDLDIINDIKEKLIKNDTLNEEEKTVLFYNELIEDEKITKNYIKMHEDTIRYNIEDYLQLESTPNELLDFICFSKGSINRIDKLLNLNSMKMIDFGFGTKEININSLNDVTTDWIKLSTPEKLTNDLLEQIPELKSVQKLLRMIGELEYD